MAKKKKVKGATLWIEGGWIHVRTPYDPGFVRELKSEIHASQRKWDPDEKIWKVDPSQDDVLVPLVAKYFGEPTVLEDKEEVVVVTQAGDDPYGALLRLAPDDVLKRVYRLVATALHPDKGGSAEKMTRANQAWKAIREDRGL